MVKDTARSPPAVMGRLLSPLLLGPAEYTFPKLFTCTADDDIHCALKTMRAEKIRRLPVIDREGGLEGIVSMDDIALHARETVDKRDISAKQDVTDTYKAICEHYASGRSNAPPVGRRSHS